MNWNIKNKCLPRLRGLVGNLLENKQVTIAVLCHMKTCIFVQKYERRVEYEGFYGQSIKKYVSLNCQPDQWRNIGN